MKNFIRAFYISAMCILAIACRKNEEEIPQPAGIKVCEAAPGANPKGFYLLNEGAMKKNNATLDYMDYTTGMYLRNIYADANPSIVKEMGDLGTDIKIYGSKIYAVINNSNKVEVMDVATAKRITKIDIPNCRYITFNNGKAFVTSYATPIEFDPNSELGFVAVIDTVSFEITKKITVGYQPEEAAIVGNKLYVANSGGYRMPDFDKTVSVIDLETLTEIKKIDVAPNLHKIKPDAYGDLYISSRGDYSSIPSKLYVLDTETGQVKAVIDTPIDDFCIDGDKLYAYSINYNDFTVGYKIVDVKTETITGTTIITDGTGIKVPASISVNPVTKEIIITDAGDFVTPGKVYSFSPAGKLLWSVIAGINPAHVVYY